MKGISNGPNSRPLNETIAETGPGIPDDSVVEGEVRPEDLGAAETERQAEALRRKGWARPSSGPPGDTDEAEAHPS